MINGPDSVIGSGSLLIIFDREVDYIVEAVAKMQRQRIKAMSVKADARDDLWNSCRNITKRPSFQKSTTLGTPRVRRRAR